MRSRFSRRACAALAAFALVILPGCQSAPAGKAASVTYNDTKTLAPDALKDRLLAQLGNLLTPAPPPPRWRRIVDADRFYDTWLATTPRLDEGASMCTYDLLRMKLESDVRDDDPDGDTPTHAVGLETTTWFAPVPKGSTDCAKRDPATTHYFESDLPTSAWLDYAMLKDVFARLGSSTPGFAITCDEEGLCKNLPVGVSPESVWDISACHRPVSDGNCRHFSWREPHYIEMDIIYDTPKLDRRIVRVHFEPSVIVN